MGGLHCDAISTRKRMRSWDGLPAPRRGSGKSYQLRFAGVKGLKQSDDFTKCRAKLDDFARDDAVGGPLKLRARDNPTDAAVRMELWAWALRNGEQEEGVAWLTEILRRDPKHAAANQALADYFERSGQPRRAAQHRAAGKQ